MLGAPSDALEELGVKLLHANEIVATIIARP
jgi:hypothetical protein